MAKTTAIGFMTMATSQAHMLSSAPMPIREGRPVRISHPSFGHLLFPKFFVRTWVKLGDRVHRNAQLFVVEGDQPMIVFARRALVRQSLSTMSTTPTPMQERGGDLKGQMAPALVQAASQQSPLGVYSRVQNALDGSSTYRMSEHTADETEPGDYPGGPSGSSMTSTLDNFSWSGDTMTSGGETLSEDLDLFWSS
jgi:hypothetical protein